MENTNDYVVGNAQNEDNGGLKYVYDLKYIASRREGRLAIELADGLNDSKSLRFYFSVALEHSERFLREIYRLTKETPQAKIKKSRGALFAYLVKKYEHYDTRD
jgi:hypothetical protein